MFKTSNPACNLTIVLAANRTGSEGYEAAPWKDYVTFDLAKAGLVIKHHGGYPTRTTDNYSINLFLRGKSAGKKEAAR
jgi:hypothetical protein